MTEEDLKRIQSAYESGLDIEIWFDGRWYKFDARDYPYGGFSTTRQYRIVGQKYVDEAEKQIKDLQEQISNLEGIVTAQGNALETEYAINAELKERNGELAGQKASLERWFGEAKVIIREYLEWADWKDSNCPSYASICKKAEAFLKE